MPDPLIRIEFDLRQFHDGFTAAVQEQIPFAFSLALTQLGREAQKAVRADLSNEFILRNNWISQNIRIDPERVPKGTMQIDVGSRMNRGNNLMELEATGGTGHGKSGGELAIPTDAVRSNRFVPVPRKSKPQSVLKQGGRGFIATINGKHGIFEREESGRYPIHMLYSLKESVKIKAIWPLETVIGTVAAARWQTLAAAALERALKPRK